ncbi:MAG: glycosyltransferase [Prochlorococcaceae cyanobacterium]|jgi:glycosyltransferase involved in cell wall biosynthesis
MASRPPLRTPPPAGSPSIGSPTIGGFSIGFDDQIFRRQRRGGISRYFRELAAALEGAGAQVRRAGREGRVWPGRPHWRQAEVVHATYYGGRPYWLGSGQRLVSSLFDMTPERHPEHFFLPALRSPHARKADWLGASDLILSISAASADDLAFFQPRIHTPVRVIHLATDLDRIAPRAVPGLEQRPFWLMVGKRHAYKNGLTLLRALALLQRQPRRELPLLVFAGGGALRPAERRWIAALGLEQAVRQIPAEDPDLAWLYRHAEAVLVPSLAEGFSLPLIEALACDTPVVASDLEVHREVGRSFASLLPALNAEAWAEWLAEGAGRSAERPRQRLGDGAYEQLRRHFGTARLLREHLAAYGDLRSGADPIPLAGRIRAGASPGPG